MRKLSIFVPVIILVLFAWVGAGCSNADNLNLPEVPNTGNDGPQGDPIDPSTPVPYSQVEFTNILDFAFGSRQFRRRLRQCPNELRRKLHSQQWGLFRDEGCEDVPVRQSAQWQGYGLEDGSRHMHEIAAAIPDCHRRDRT